MNQFLTDWLAALRSGEYKQGQGKLKSTKGYYCCLGVACEINREIGKFDEWASFVLDQPYRSGNYKEETFVCMPPIEILKLMGLPDEMVSYKYGDILVLKKYVSREVTNDHVYEAHYKKSKMINVAHLNDTVNLSFLEIADALDKTYLELTSQESE